MSHHPTTQILIFIFLSTFLLTLHPVIDPDYWWHLRVGQEIVITSYIPRVDFLSFSLPGHPYVYHSWLSEVIFYLVHHHLGFWGATLIFPALFGLAFVIIAKISLLHLKNPLYLVSFLLFSDPIYTSTSTRTQIFTLILNTSLFYLLERYLITHAQSPPKNYFSSPLWFIPLLFIPWVSLHGGFILGLAVLAFWTLTLATIPEKSLPHKSQHLKHLALIFLLSCVATLVNPYFYHTHLQALDFVTNLFNFDHNPDWTSIISKPHPVKQISNILLLVFTILHLTTPSIPTRKKLFLAIFTILSIITSRFFIVATLALAIDFPHLLATLTSRLKKKSFPQLPKSLLYSLATSALLIYSYFAFSIAGRTIKNPADLAQYSKISVSYPYGALNYLQTTGFQGRTFNAIEWGGYLIWNLPGQRFFIDGRMDNFFVNGQSFAKTYLHTAQAEPGWQDTFNHFAIDTVLMPPDTPIVATLLNDPNWHILYQDAVSVLITKKPAF